VDFNLVVINKTMRLSLKKSIIVFNFSFTLQDTSNGRVPNAKKKDNIVIGLSGGSYVSEQKANFLDRDLK